MNQTQGYCTPSPIIREEFSLKNATLLGGYNLFKDFLDKIDFENTLQQSIGFGKNQNATYPLWKVIALMTEGYAVGLERLYHFASIENDPLMKLKHGIEKLPDFTLYSKDLNRFTNPVSLIPLKEVNRRLLAGSIRKEGQVVLDFDSTVEIVYGNQEGAAVGYNPKKRGRKSYQPLLAYTTSGWGVNGHLRPGNVRSSDDIIPFMEETFALVPPGIRILARLDSGFDAENPLSYLEFRHIGYVVKLKSFDPLKLAILKIPKERYQKFSEGDRELEVIRIQYQAGSWERERSVIVVRWKADDGTQGSFFDELEYCYVAVVTNLSWNPLDIYRFYNHRGICENQVKESKLGLHSSKICSQSFFANAADLLVKLVAFNLLRLFQKKLFPKRDGFLSAATVRRLFFYIPGRLIHTGRTWILKLQAEFAYQTEWMRMRKALARC